MNLEYSSQTPIDTLIIGNSDAADQAPVGNTSFTGSVNIRQATVNGNAGEVHLNVQGTIGSLEPTGDNPQLVLGDSTSIVNLIVPPSVNPATIFVNDDDLSSVKAVNGQSTAPVSTPQPTPTCSANGCY